MASRRIRSRGCEQCRRRRVKCDESGDFCRQCIRFGLDCSGPIRGPTIIDMTTEAAYPLERAGTPLNKRPRKARRASEPVSLPTPAPSVEPGESSDNSGLSLYRSISSTPEKDHVGPVTIRKQVLSNDRHHRGQIPILYRPSNAEALELFLVSQFLSFSQPSAAPGLPRAWLKNIPEWMLSSQVPAFRFSIRAATLALHAKMHNDIAARTESYRWYVITLNKFRIYLKDQTERGLLEGNPKYIPGTEEILIATFCCLFEALSNESLNTPRGVLQHLAACCKILELRGPDNCRKGLFHQLFMTYRISSAHIALIIGNPSKFASDSWRNSPFDEQGKTFLHQLVDIMLIIPVCLEQAGYKGPIDRIIQSLSKSTTPQLELEHRSRLLLKQSEHWWKAYSSSPPESSDRPFSVSGPNLEYQEVIPAAIQYSPTLFLHRDTVTPFTVSLYNATCLILHTILRTLSTASEHLPHRSQAQPSSDSKHYFKQAIFHSNSILYISTHHREKKPNGINFLRSIFPLKIVELLGPPDQSEQAKVLTAQFRSNQTNTPTAS